MHRPRPIDYADASPEVRAVFDDIKTRRKVEDVNNFWKYLATVGAGALESLVKEMIYLAVSVTSGCSYGIACHTTPKAGMAEVMARRRRKSPA